MTIEEKLENFYKVSMENAREESAKDLEEYRASLDRVFEQHKAETLQNLQNAIETEKTESAQKSNMEISREQMEMKRRVSARENELTEKIFEETSRLLEEYRKTPEYRATLVKQIQDACEFAKGEPLRMYIDAADEALLPDLEKAADGRCEVKISKESFGGGTRGVLHSMNILIDNSFKKKFGELRADFKLSHEL